MSNTVRKRLLLAAIIVAGFSLAYLSAASFTAPATTPQAQQPDSPAAICQEVGDGDAVVDRNSIPDTADTCEPASGGSAGGDAPSASPAVVPR